MYGYQDLPDLKCKGEADLERYHERFKAIRLQLTTDVDEKLVQIMYHDNIKSLITLP